MYAAQTGYGIPALALARSINRIHPFPYRCYRIGNSFVSFQLNVGIADVESKHWYLFFSPLQRYHAYSFLSNHLCTNPIAVEYNAVIRFAIVIVG
jgi:hypothetical protein